MSGSEQTSSSHGPASLGRTLRAARQRRGWSRETLAHYAGLSAAAIAQIESGRRSDVRLRSLQALAEALSVTVDHLVGTRAGAAPAPMLDHRALIHHSEDEFLSEIAPFAREGVARGEAVLVVVAARRAARLRRALGDAAQGVEFHPPNQWYSSPGAALSGYREFIAERVAAGATWLRIVGEPVWDDRTPAEKRMWGRYESVINLTLAAAPTTLVCAYDASTLPPAVVQIAHRTHGTLCGPDGPMPCAHFQDPASFLFGEAPR